MPEITDKTLSQITNLVRFNEINQPFVDIASLACAVGIEHDELAQYVHLSHAVSHGAKRVEMQLGADEETPFQMAHSYYLNANAVLHIAQALHPCVLRVALFMLHGYMMSYEMKAAA